MLLMIVTSICSAVTPNHMTCPPWYVRFGDDCFYVSYVRLSWKEALRFCRRNDSDLMSVHSSFEQGKAVLSKLSTFLQLVFE